MRAYSPRSVERRRTWFAGPSAGAGGPTLRLARAEDAAFLEALFRSARAGQFAQAGLSPSMIDALLGQQYRLQTAGYAAQFPDATSLLIERAGEPVGRLLLACRADHWHVVDVALLAAQRGQGVGTAVVGAVAAAARAQGAQALTLAVMSTNVAARRFYRRAGFVEVGAAVGTHLAMRLALVT